MKFFVKTFLLAGIVSAFVSANAAETDSLRVDSDQCVDGAKIESIEFEGLEHTKPRVVWRELTHKVGGAFSQKTFESEKLRLQDLDLFTDVYVSCKKQLDPSTSPNGFAQDDKSDYSSSTASARRFCTMWS